MTDRISRSDSPWATTKFVVIIGLTLDGVNTVLSYDTVGVMNTDYRYTGTRLYYPPTRDEKVWWDQVWHTMIDDRIDRMTISLPSNRTDYRTNSVSVYRGIFTYQR